MEGPVKNLFPFRSIHVNLKICNVLFPTRYVYCNVKFKKRFKR